MPPKSVQRFSGNGMRKMDVWSGGRVSWPQVLTATMPVAQILGVQEEVPRMHDIFIRAVSEEEPAAVTTGMTE